MSYGTGYGDGYGSRSGLLGGLGRSILIRAIPILIAVVIAGLTMTKGCQRGPFGRSQLVAINTQEEMALGAQAFQEVLAENRGNIVGDPAVVDAVKRVAQNLVRGTHNEQFLQLVQLQTPDFQWDLRVVRSSQVNAFCLPGGKIVVYTGILPIAQTEAGLAVVMGHEIGHALAHHGAERMAQQKLVQIGQMAAAGSMSDMDPMARQRLIGLLSAGANLGILRYSRKHESEADHIGLDLMAAAGYDPGEAPKFWVRMQSAAGAGQHMPEFASTHPSHERRIADLQELLPEAERIFQNVAPQPDGNKRLPVRVTQ
jgi:predicted Zn-dependent protease